MSAWTSSDLAALEKAIASGVTHVKYADKDVTYRSLAEMKQIRDMIRKELGLGGNGSRKVASHSRGTR